jgi:uncharacterized protein YgiM (DUF1202 family)
MADSMTVQCFYSNENPGRRCVMKKNTICLLALCLTALFATSVFGQQVMYVQSLKAKVMKGPSFRSAIVGEIGKGHMVTLTGKEGNWANVRFGPREEGYISMLLLSKHPPISKQGLIKAEEGVISTSVRRRASTYTSAAAARGLAADDRRRLSVAEKSDYTSLEKIEEFTLPEDEILKFAKNTEEAI